jgi:hypothetical protein
MRPEQLVVLAGVVSVVLISCRGSPTTLPRGCFAMELRADPDSRIEPAWFLDRAPRTIQVEYHPQHDRWSTWPLPLDTTLERPFLDTHAERIEGDSLVLKYGDFFNYLVFRLKILPDSLVGVFTYDAEVGRGGRVGSAVARPIQCLEERAMAGKSHEQSGAVQRGIETTRLPVD